MARNWFGGALVAAALMAGLVGAQAQEKKPLTVGMTTWVGYGLLHLADKKGFFKQNGADVSLVTVQDKPSTAAAITTGRMDGWATTVDTFIFYNAAKIGVKQVLAVDYSMGGEGLIASADVKSVADLKGRTVAAEPGSSTYFFLLNVLAEQGLSIADIKLQSMRAGDAGAAFAAGRVDAAATWDPWLAKAAERGGRILVSTSDKPGLIVDTVAFRADVIEKRPVEVQGFIKGYFQAYDYWKANRSEANDVMAKALGIGAEEFKASLAGIDFVSRAKNQEYIGSPGSAGLIKSVTKRGLEFYQQLALVKEAFDPDAVVDVSPLAAALAK